ncbi:CidA/LrgA family protein [Paenibacillus sp. 481]|uniref:CidA/LrgA family protein n=1 Tax=Paenibacillus sp. 481 TaxID=2835869 RepID=UPI001E5625B2|nr:CidA/LrgA family protein [Paenibacillus sp. 481]UHA73243.1 CidA/LrgA family protein [Paenibacillus sp. 481]
MIGFAILLGFNVLGVGLHNMLHIPLPGNVIGLILFLMALGLKWIKLEWVERSAQFLMQHMLLFFVPYVVGVIAFLPILQTHWVSIGITLIGSTLLVLWVTGVVASKLQVNVNHTNDAVNSVRKEGGL